MRYPGVMLGADEAPFQPLLRLVATQLKVSMESWSEYGQRGHTRPHAARTSGRAANGLRFPSVHDAALPPLAFYTCFTLA